MNSPSLGLRVKKRYEILAPLLPVRCWRALFGFFRSRPGTLLDEKLGDALELRRVRLVEGRAAIGVGSIHVDAKLRGERHGLEDQCVAFGSRGLNPRRPT